MPRLSTALVSLAANYIKTPESADGRRRDPTGEKIATREPKLVFDAANADGVMTSAEKAIITDTFANANWASRPAKAEYEALARRYGIATSVADSHSTSGSSVGSSSGSSSSVGSHSGGYSTPSSVGSSSGGSGYLSSWVSVGSSS